MTEPTHPTASECSSLGAFGQALQGFLDKLAVNPDTNTTASVTEPQRCRHTVEVNPSQTFVSVYLLTGHAIICMTRAVAS